MKVKEHVTLDSQHQCRTVGHEQGKCSAVQRMRTSNLCKLLLVDVDVIVTLQQVPPLVHLAQDVPLQDAVWVDTQISNISARAIG